jgi:hypothetical protein
MELPAVIITYKTGAEEFVFSKSKKHYLTSGDGPIPILAAIQSVVVLLLQNVVRHLKKVR